MRDDVQTRDDIEQDDREEPTGSEAARSRRTVIATTVAVLLVVAGLVVAVPALAASAPSGGTGGGSTEPGPLSFSCDADGYCSCEVGADCLALIAEHPECADWDFEPGVGAMFCRLPGPDYEFPEEPVNPNVGDAPGTGGNAIGPDDVGPADRPSDPGDPEDPEDPPTQAPSEPGTPGLPPGVNPGDVLGPDDVPGGVDSGRGRTSPTGSGGGSLDPGGFDR